MPVRFPHRERGVRYYSGGGYLGDKGSRYTCSDFVVDLSWGESGRGVAMPPNVQISLALASLPQPLIISLPPYCLQQTKVPHPTSWADAIQRLYYDELAKKKVTPTSASAT